MVAWLEIKREGGTEGADEQGFEKNTLEQTPLRLMNRVGLLISS
jgi:hypothetical protein